jgi:predicted O-linked N-acetylglucosamine transferase (SPINDLY family)
MTADPDAAAIGTALAQLHRGDNAAALAILESLPPAPRDTARHAALGMVHLAAGRHEAALGALRLGVSLGDRTPGTLLNLALAEDHAGDTGRAAQVMRVLRETFPEWDEPPLREAERLRRRNDAQAAEAAYARVLEITPTRPEALIGLAMLLLARGAAPRAQLLLLRCCAAAPGLAEAWDALGLTLMLTGDARAAASAFATAQQRAPADPDIALRLVQAAIAAGDGEGQLARLEQASAADPLSPVLLLARGALLEQLGRRDDAIELLEAACALAPDLPATAAALAHALVRANRIGPALAALERAIALAPDDASPGTLDLRNNHAACLVRLQRFAAARDALEALIASHGPQPGFLANLTNAQISLGLHDAALATARQLTTLHPGLSLSWRTLCNALPYCPGIGGAELLAAYRRTAQSLPAPAQVALANPKNPDRRLRLGLLSGTLKTHPVGWLTVAGLEALDPAAFEIICLGPQTPDHLQRRFQAIAAAWHPVEGADAAARLRTLDIDILIDLGGYGDQGLMTLCAERLAPVQIKWVGSQNHSTGLPNMDRFISDRWETPPGSEAFYSERLLILPDGYVCYSPPAYAPDVAELPARRSGAITFGCFNNLAKITAEVIACWSGILARLPGARLILKCHQCADAPTRARLRDAFAAHGIDPARIALRANAPHRTLLGEYADIDIVLDPFPYSGGLTTCEALWMGVPTITMPGESFASRHSASHMSNIGLADWIAADLPAYQDMAVRRAADIPALAALRAGLRPRMAASPLCDAPRFGRNLGAALRQAWHEWCATP